MELTDIEKYFTPLAIKMMNENGITLSVLSNRIHHGMSLDESFSFKNRGRKTDYPKWVYDMAKKNGISRQTLHNRIKITRFVY